MVERRVDRVDADAIGSETFEGRLGPRREDVTRRVVDGCSANTNEPAGTLRRMASLGKTQVATLVTSSPPRTISPLNDFTQTGST
jgi:hypothetical protein